MARRGLQCECETGQRKQEGHEGHDISAPKNRAEGEHQAYSGKQSIERRRAVVDAQAGVQLGIRNCSIQTSECVTGDLLAVDGNDLIAHRNLKTQTEPPEHRQESLHLHNIYIFQGYFVPRFPAPSPRNTSTQCTIPHSSADEPFKMLLTSRPIGSPPGPWVDR